MIDMSAAIWRLEPPIMRLFGRYKRFDEAELADWLCCGMPSGEAEYTKGLCEIWNEQSGWNGRWFDAR